jgi:hypothetical protein
MPLHPGPWQTPPPRQQAVDTYSGPLGAEGWNEQYADADPVTFGGSWAALLNPPITYSTSTSRDLTIEHIYDPIGYLGQPLEDWALTQGLLDITPQLHLPAGGWSPPLPWPAGAVDWEYDLSGIRPGLVYELLDLDLKLTATVSVSDALDAAGYASRGETALATDIIVTPVDPSTLILDAGLTGQEPRIQNVTQTQLLAWPVIGRGTPPVGGSVGITVSEIDVATYLACLDIFAGATATLRLAVSYDNHRTGTEPARGTYRDITFNSIDFTSDWQPPRWRFLYDRLPPLRQYPRDDYLGGAPRQGHTNGPTSTQGSARQGWRGTYR